MPLAPAPASGSRNTLLKMFLKKETKAEANEQPNIPPPGEKIPRTDQQPQPKKVVGALDLLFSKKKKETEQKSKNNKKNSREEVIDLDALDDHQEDQVPSKKSK